MLSKMTNGEQLSLLCDQLQTNDTQGQPNAKPLEGEIDQERIRWEISVAVFQASCRPQGATVASHFGRWKIRGEGKCPSAALYLGLAVSVERFLSRARCLGGLV